MKLPFFPIYFSILSKGVSRRKKGKRSQTMKKWKTKRQAKTKRKFQVFLLLQIRVPKYHICSKQPRRVINCKKKTDLRSSPDSWDCSSYLCRAKLSTNGWHKVLSTVLSLKSNSDRLLWGRTKSRTSRQWPREQELIWKCRRDVRSRVTIYNSDSRNSCVQVEIDDRPSKSSPFHLKFKYLLSSSPLRRQRLKVKRVSSVENLSDVTLNRINLNNCKKQLCSYRMYLCT